MSLLTPTPFAPVTNPYSSTALLASLKRRGLIPSSTQTFTAADFYKIVDDETQTYIVPLLMGVREEYLVAYKDITIEDGVTEYNIPINAIGGKIRDITVSTDTNSYVSIPRYEPERAGATTPGPAGYYLRANKIVLTGTLSTGTLRVSYYRRPNRVVALNECVRIGDDNILDGTPVWEVLPDPDGSLIEAAFDSAAGEAVPSAWARRMELEIVKGTPGFDTIIGDQELQYSSATSALIEISTFQDDDVPDRYYDPGEGDYICLAGETPIPQIPVELHPLLAQRVTATVLQALGDAKAKAAYELAADMEKRVLKLITPRTEGSSRYVTNQYGVGRNRPYRRF